MKFRNIAVEANYGWTESNRSAVIQIPEEEMDDVEEYVRDWVMDGITWSWNDITKEE